MATNVDAFILFNEKEDKVARVATYLDSIGISTFFWRRDTEFGEQWQETESQHIKDARVVLVFLGTAGWGPNHLRITEEAQRLGRRIIPILIGDPLEEDFHKASALFHSRRYLDLREFNPTSLKMLVDAIRRQEASEAGQFDRIVAVLVDGNEEQRATTLHQVQISKTLNRPALANRIRAEVQDRFGPGSESAFASAIRDPKKISSIRSWMLSLLTWVDSEGPDSREVLLRHLRSDFEPDRNVRFWILAGLYQAESSYLTNAASICLSDPAPEVAAMAQAIATPINSSLISQFRSDLASKDFETVWPVLRLLRVVPIPELARDVCAQLERITPGSFIAYDALYALSNPVMAREAAPILLQQLEPTGIVERVIAEARGSNSNSIRNFAVLLAALPNPSINRALAAARQTPETADIAGALIDYLRLYGRSNVSNLFVAGYASDTINIQDDRLNIQEDVQTLTAIALAKEVIPPLAIGLFGDWGSGKSFFMKSIRAATDNLANRSRESNSQTFCSEIVQIEFNAWHYVDTNLWASLVSYILEQMAVHVSPQLTDEQRHANLLSELGSTKALVKDAEEERKRTEELIQIRQDDLMRFQLERQGKEVRLRDLRLSDITALLPENERQRLTESLKRIGVPAALNSVSDLSGVISEAYTVQGRLTALFFAILTSKNRSVLITLLTFSVVVIPLCTWVFREYLNVDDVVVRLAAFLSEAIAITTGARVVLRKALTQMNTSLKRVEEAKQQIDKILVEKRKNPAEEETDLQNQIVALKAKEQEASSRLSAATARSLELEERIRSFNEERSLARFLAERTRSEDYRQHLGLISTIRRDFESLSARLARARSGADDTIIPVDRIILYIDDLDRCPADKVMEVLQAVHLLLAYPLFVVFVGVDPRWLLHSLGTTYSAFQKSGDSLGDNPDVWRTTPQNYLEKIFQIPFSLRPMTAPGYGALIDGLLSPSPILEGAGISATQKASIESRLDDVQLPPQGLVPRSAEPADLNNPPQENSVDSESKAQPNIPMEPDPEPKPPFVIYEESLLIRAWETKFAEVLFSLIPTPRAAKRFSNIYRILKAPVGREILPSFEGTAELPGDFQVPMLLLAILIGASAEAAVLFPKLQQHAAEGRNMLAALQQFDVLGLSSSALAELEERIRPIIAERGFPNTPEVFLEWIPRVSRFSFELNRIVRPIIAAGAPGYEKPRQI
jgi:hypothetical protein